MSSNQKCSCSGDLKSGLDHILDEKRGLFARGQEFKWDLKSRSPSTILNLNKWPLLYQKAVEIWAICLDFNCIRS